MERVAHRLYLSIAAAGLGWLGGIAFLRVMHPWAYDTEFRWWALISGAYAALLMIFIAGWIAGSHAVWRSLIMRFALAATALSLCLLPFTGAFSIVLLLTGHAYVVAAIAGMVYAGCLPLSAWSRE